LYNFNLHLHNLLYALGDLFLVLNYLIQKHKKFRILKREIICIIQNSKFILYIPEYKLKFCTI